MEHEGNLYKFVSDGSISARQAGEACEREGALLVSINSEREMLFIKERVLRQRTLSAFIGGAAQRTGRLHSVLCQVRFVFFYS